MLHRGGSKRGSLSAVEQAVEVSTRLHAQSVGDAVREAGDAFSGAMGMQYVDLLTGEEVRELGLVTKISGTEEGAAFAERVNSDERLAGMYRQFEDMGLVECLFDGGDAAHLVYPRPKAFWALERRERLDLERRERERDETARRRADIVFQLVIQLAAVGFGWLLSSISSGQIKFP